MLYSRKDSSLSFNRIAEAIAYCKDLASKDRFYRLALYNSKQKSIGIPHYIIELQELINETDNGVLEIRHHTANNITTRLVPFRLITGPESWGIYKIPEQRRVATFDRFSEAREAIWNPPYSGHDHNVQFVGGPHANH